MAGEQDAVLHDAVMGDAVGSVDLSGHGVHLALRYLFVVICLSGGSSACISFQVCTRHPGAQLWTHMICQKIIRVRAVRVADADSLTCASESDCTDSASGPAARGLAEDALEVAEEQIIDAIVTWFHNQVDRDRPVRPTQKYRRLATVGLCFFGYISSPICVVARCW